MPDPQQTAPSADAPPTFRYTAALAADIETRWQLRWDEHEVFRQPNPGEEGFDASRPKFFCMDMFPYPSGAGLHVGHPEGYTATDIVCRYRKMQGWNVLHPMGYDAFGLPAEQYAIQTGVHPATTTRQAIDNFTRQLKRLGFCYDWSRQLATIDEDFYRWTQWIFLQIYDSWFDTTAGDSKGRARPISELVKELVEREREPRINPDAAEYSAEDKARRFGPWSALDKDQKRTIIDSYRLAYIAEQTVNWCPKLGTALANEEVIDAKSERGSFPVFRKPLRQWLFRITAYAGRFLEDLDNVQWPDSTRAQQTEWIGRSEGADIDFRLSDPPAGAGGALRVFTTRPDTIFGATYMVVAPEHALVDAVIESDLQEAEPLRDYAAAARNRTDIERQEDKTKTGVFTGVHAVNPATGAAIPVWCADYVLAGYGSGAIMAVPGQDQRDWDFAKTFGLSIVRTVQPPQDFDGEAFTGEGPAINSGFLDGLGVSDAKSKAIDWLEAQSHGARQVNYKLRDWLFSRQRYWGEPFPIVYDAEGDHHPVGPDALPVTLPDLADYQPIESDEPIPLLGKATDWVATTAGEAGVPTLRPGATVRRETNTMPGWAGSCWYYLRYCDPKNQDRFVSRAAERYWMSTPKNESDRARAAEFGTFQPDLQQPGGVDLYIGGAEHAVLHLLYARFWHKVLFDLGELTTPEPFQKLFHQGMITSYAYQRKDKTLVPTDQVEDRDGEYIETATGAELTRVVAKMSKSLKNVINPDDVIQEFGADTFRLYEMYMGPLEASKPWDTRAIGGMFRFLQRLWRVVIDEDSGKPRLADAPDADLERRLHRTIAKVQSDIDSMSFNTAIAAMIEMVNDATAKAGDRGYALSQDQAQRLALTLCPFAPHMAEELWLRLGAEGIASQQPWPTYDEAMLVDDQVEIPVQIKGKVRARITVAADLDAKALEAAALDDDKVKAAIGAAAVRKVIAIPGKMVNIVTG